MGVAGRLSPGEEAHRTVMFQHRCFQLIEIKPSSDTAVRQKLIQIQMRLSEILPINDAVFQQNQRFARYRRPGFE